MRKFYNQCCGIYSGLSPLDRMALKFISIVVLAVIYFALVNTKANGEEKKEEVKQETSFISCDNPAGCVGKFRKGVDWPVCPICNTPISSSVNVSENGNISEEIVSLFEETRSLYNEIEEIIKKRHIEEQERIEKFKAYDIVHAKKVCDNMFALKQALARTKIFVEKGGKIPDIPDDKNKDKPVWVIVCFGPRGEPVWKKIEDFPVYPRPK